LTTQSIDFNSDLGEGYGWWERGADEAMLGCVSSANIACGFHAGDPGTMRSSVTRALQGKVAIGAHPGYPDLLGFGRRRLDVAASDVRNYVLYQVGALAAFAGAAGARLHHVKPHGALYMTALEDAAVARAIAEAAAEHDDSLFVYTLEGSEMWHAALKAGLPAAAEFFADRPMRPDGSVVMFQWWEQFEATPESVSNRVREFLSTGTVTAIDGRPVSVRAETICVHSDTPGAGLIGPAVRAALDQSGVTVSAP
jgi:UPF0271 protein